MRRASANLSTALAGLAALALLCGSCPRAGAEATLPGDGWGPEKQGFRLRLELPEAVAAPDAPRPSAARQGRVLLRLTLRNVTARPLCIADAHPEFDYRLTLRNAAGKVIPPTRAVSPVTRRVLLKIQPGGELVQTYDLTRMYGPRADGEYSIVARRYVWRLDGQGNDEVESNPIATVVGEGRMRQLASRAEGVRTSSAPSACLPYSTSQPADDMPPVTSADPPPRGR